RKDVVRGRDGAAAGRRTREQAMTTDAAAAVALDRAGDEEPAIDAPTGTARGVEPAAETLPPERVPILEKLFLRRLQRGDPRAFRELVRRHQDRVYGLSYRMLGDPHEAE